MSLTSSSPWGEVPYSIKFLPPDILVGLEAALEVPSRLELVIEVADERVDVACLRKRLCHRDIFMIESMPPRKLHGLVLGVVNGGNPPPSRCRACGAGE